MTVHPQIKYAKVDDLRLDRLNPRLGREAIAKKLNQKEILDEMRDWSLEELAVSFLEMGFWPQEPLIVVQEKKDLVVVEGNRRLAALILLQEAVEGNPVSAKWQSIISGVQVPKNLFSKVPYFEADSRDDVSAFLGFRHVTGIKEWRPAEKAEFIANLIEKEGLTYDQVMRRIGSKLPTVRQNYIAYRMLLQMEELEGVAIEKVEKRFSVLYLSLRTEGAQNYLQIDVMADPETARTPIPKSHLKNLKRFAFWLFGDAKRPPVLPDSRQIDDFGRVLQSPKAVEYLERTERPSFEAALDLAGGDEPQVIEYVLQAGDNLRLALQRAHLHKKSEQLKSAVEEAGRHAAQLVKLYPDLAKELSKELAQNA